MALRLRHRNITLVVILSWFFSLISLSLAVANLDIIEPILRKSPDSTVFEDSFGWSIVLHQVEEPDIGDFNSFINNTRIIVGAPHGNYPGGLDGLPALMPESNTGLVYQCSLKPLGSCEGIGNSEDSRSNDRRLFDGDPNMIIDTVVNTSENKSEQLMGGSLSSNNNFFVACAPRYTVIPTGTDFDGRRSVGRCFVSLKNLTGFQLLQPCGGRNTNPRLNLDNNCVSGFSVTIADQQNEEATVVLGIIGESSFRGNLRLYNVSSDATTESGISTGAPTSGPQSLYDGYSVTTGFINNRRNSGIRDYISGVPRNDGISLAGAVRVRPQASITVFPGEANIIGSQAGEYFGSSVVAVDLNNDGYDELAVGAPIYGSISSREMGRVYIYENIGGALNTTPIILGGNMISLARFGYSIVNLGDINGDSYEDIAIGAPYEPSGENTGAVYIYYGTSSALGLISQSPNQVLYSQDIVQRLSSEGLDSLRTFGFSLASGVDVDGNEVNDLVVGAQESKAAILFRSLSVAYITVDVSVNTDIIQLDTTGNDGSTFVLTVCANYNGRGLDNRPLTTPLNISEIVSNNVNRIYFNNETISENSFLTEFVFNTTDSDSCMDIPVFVKAVSDLILGQVDLRAPLELIVTFPPIPRREADFTSLLDYRDIPFLIVDGNSTVSVEPSVNCSRDMNMQEVCNPDLTVTLITVSYRDSLNTSAPRTQVTAGSTQTAVIDLQYSNIGAEPAFGSLITFTLPERFTFVRVDVPTDALPINCQPSGDNQDRLYRCDLPNYIPPLRSTQAPPCISLIWRLRVGIIGNEPDDISNITIMLTQSSSSEDMETDTSNNDLINGPLVIEYTAISDIAISSFVFTASPTSYRGEPPVENPNFAQIGQRVVLVLSAVNRGPSVSPNVSLDIYLPTNSSENLFYIYPFSIMSTLSSTRGSISCDQSPFNPQRLAPPPSGIVNTKRSVKNKRQTSDTTPAPLTKDGILISTETRNCSNAGEGCTHVQCSITNFLSAVTARITITAALDERFFVDQINNFIFEARATIQNVEDYIQDVNSTNDQSRTEFRVILFVEPEMQSFPIWIPIVCGVVAVIVIIILFVLLYFVGFFRRKKREEEEEDKEAEGEPNVEQIPSNIRDPDDINEKKLSLCTEEKIVHSPLVDDIGDADDLQDGDVNVAEKDPEETSL